jgi:hypothetical protein
MPAPAQDRGVRARARDARLASADRSTWSNADWLANARRAGDSHPFLIGCRLAGIEPTAGEAHRWRKGRGRALEAAWARWPRSKSLPKLRSAT